ncbi:hypothetical protein [Streptomyces sp. NPDC048737]|uniref:hypothetical protein n=1 Tax=Streptomyces sp. NPDC048737 TaxID=3155764 RepID=UPI00342B8AD5
MTKTSWSVERPKAMRDVDTVVVVSIGCAVKPGREERSPSRKIQVMTPRVAATVGAQSQS